MKKIVGKRFTINYHEYSTNKYNLVLHDESHLPDAANELTITELTAEDIKELAGLFISIAFLNKEESTEG